MFLTTLHVRSVYFSNLIRFLPLYIRVYVYGTRTGRSCVCIVRGEFLGDSTLYICVNLYLIEEKRSAYTNACERVEGDFQRDRNREPTVGKSREAARDLASTSSTREKQRTSQKRGRKTDR